MFGRKIRLSAAFHERLKKCAQAAGYSSAEELVHHALEKAVAEIEQADWSEAVKARLRGLKYIE